MPEGYKGIYSTLGIITAERPQSAFKFFTGSVKTAPRCLYNTYLAMERKHESSWDEMMGHGERRMHRHGHKRRRVEHSRHDYRSSKRLGTIGQARADRGWPTSLVRPVVTDHNFVRRTYTSDRAYTISNLSTVRYNANAWTLNFVFDAVTNSAHAEVMLGSPQQGVGTTTGVLFQNLEDEFQALTNVYRYFRVTKFQMNISKLPAPVYMPSQPVPTVPTNQQQGGTWTNAGDPGRYLLRPWTGAPGVANYSTGGLTAVDWDDHARFANAKIESAVGHVDHPIKYAVTPIQPVIISDNASVADPTGVVQYEPVPAIDISNFSTGACEASCYGIIQYWYFPACVNATTGFLATSCTWEIEVEYFGLKPPTAYTPAPAALPQGQAYVDSKEALIASMTGDAIELVPKPAKVVPPDVTAAQVQEKKEAESLSTAMSDVVIVSSQPAKAAAAKIPSQQSSLPKLNNSSKKK